MNEKPGPNHMERMANVIGHEIRNPLAVIGNSAYFVKAKLGEKLDPKVEKHLKMIESEVRRANDLIGQLLTYARPVEISPQPVKAREIVDGALAAVPAPAKVKVSVEARQELMVRADRDIAVAALKRLLENSFEALSETGGKVSVAIAQACGGVEITVRDSGPGLSAQAKARLFEPFSSTKPKGLGLGLATARKFAEKHGGNVEVIEGGSGAAFKLRLPPA